MQIKLIAFKSLFYSIYQQKKRAMDTKKKMMMIEAKLMIMASIVEKIKEEYCDIDFNDKTNLKLINFSENDYRLLDKGFKCNKIRLALRKKNMYDFEMKNLCINITKYYILRAFG